MITNLRIQNFQSLVDVDLEIERFTVIVGPSSSGKTACVRALKVLHENSRGTPYVTHGQKLSCITLKREDAKVSLTRGGTTGTYEAQTSAGTQTFTKLAGQTPEAVRAVLGVPDGTVGLFIGEQFHSPYLLDETGSAIAKTLGDLTNVSIIFGAVREANRRKLETGSLLKTRQFDLSQIVSQVAHFKSLPDKLEALSVIEEKFKKIEALEIRIESMVGLIKRIEVAESVVSQVPKIVELPSVDLVDKIDYDYCELLNYIQRHDLFLADVISYRKALIIIDLELGSLEIKEHEMIVSMGSCPVCGQKTVNL